MGTLKDQKKMAELGFEEGLGFIPDADRHRFLRGKGGKERITDSSFCILKNSHQGSG
jgi:hypothetical protein